MDEVKFDAMARVWGQSRRRVLTGVVLLLAAQTPLGAAATSGATCAGDGRPCRHAAQCCSGVCHRRACRRAAEQGTCTIMQDSCAAAAPEFCNQQSGSTCACFVTTAGASFCGGGGGACAACTSNAQCAKRLGVAGAACVRAPGAACCDRQALTTACVSPCPPA